MELSPQQEFEKHIQDHFTENDLVLYTPSRSVYPNRDTFVARIKEIDNRRTVNQIEDWENEPIYFREYCQTLLSAFGKTKDHDLDKAVATLLKQIPIYSFGSECVKPEPWISKRKRIE